VVVFIVVRFCERRWDVREIGAGAGIFLGLFLIVIGIVGLVTSSLIGGVIFILLGIALLGIVWFGFN